MRIKISRKEAKESIYWLKLIDIKNDTILARSRDYLVKEGTELMLIFSSIMRKSF